MYFDTNEWTGSFSRSIFHLVPGTGVGDSRSLLYENLSANLEESLAKLVSVSIYDKGARSVFSSSRKRPFFDTSGQPVTLSTTKLDSLVTSTEPNVYMNWSSMTEFPDKSSATRCLILHNDNNLGGRNGGMLEQSMAIAGDFPVVSGAESPFTNDMKSAIEMLLQTLSIRCLRCTGIRQLSSAEERWSSIPLPWHANDGWSENLLANVRNNSGRSFPSCNT